MRHQHSSDTKTGQPGTNKAISRRGKNLEYKQKSNAQSHSGLTHAVLVGGISRLILGTILTCLTCAMCLDHFQRVKSMKIRTEHLNDAEFSDFVNNSNIITADDILLKLIY